MRESKDGPTVKQPILPKWLMLIILSVFPLTGIIILIANVWLLVSGAIEGYPILYLLLSFIIFGGVGFFLIVLGWNYYSSVMAEYQYIPDGVLVKYPLQKQVLLPWNGFQDACVCYSACNSGRSMGNSVICFVKQGEKKNSCMRWKTDNPFRHRRVICIDFTPELYEKIKAVCPYEIPDLRNSPAYKLYR